MSERSKDNLIITSPQAEHDAHRSVTPETPCPYLPGRRARNEAYIADPLPGGMYELLMNRGFRRSAGIVYRPQCRGCRECRSLRVPVARFQPSRSMRRVWKRNVDVTVDVTPPEPTDEKFEVYRRYLDGRHDGNMPRTYSLFHDFLYHSPTDTWEFVYRLGRRLVGAGIADLCPSGFSSVYMYFDPEFADRSLGTYSVLWEIQYTAEQHLAYYYMGYHVAGSRTMDYKARFRPNEILSDELVWVPFRE